jgi:hypothetical protein
MVQFVLDLTSPAGRRGMKVEDRHEEVRKDGIHYFESH